MYSILNLFNIFNIINIFLLLNVISVPNIYSISRNIPLRNMGLRLIIFKEKKLGKMIKNMKNMYNLCYNKAIVSTAEGIHAYNEMSEDEKTLVEAVLSLCY
jgi:hypothetical protein